MPYYTCKVAEQSGKVITSKYFAESMDDVRLLVERDGFLLLQIGESSSTISLGKRRISFRDFLTFNQELYVLLKSGQPVVKALESVLEKASGKKAFEKVLENIKKDVEQGLALSEAMEKYPDYFPSLYMANIKAGEKGGNLVERLKDYQVYMKKVEDLRRKIRTSATYPVFILCFIFLAVIFMFTYVIPNFSKIFLDSNVPLPVLTRIFLAISKSFTFALPFLIVGIIAGVILYKRYTRTHTGRLKVDDMKLRIPLISEMYRNYLVSNFARTLSAILKGGIPLVTALRTASAVADNIWFAERLKEVTLRVEEGNALSSALDQTGVFPPISLRLIKAGEGTGGLWEMLDEVAEYYDNLVVDSLTMISNLVEPILIVVMGLMVAIIVVAMYLPIFNMAGAVTG